MKRNRELPTKDWLEYRNARELCGMIRDFWSKKGHRVELSIDPVPMENPAHVYAYQIRSNMINGLPRGA